MKTLADILANPKPLKPYTLADYEKLAKNYFVDTYGKAWKKEFAFDLAAALYVYLPGNWDGNAPEEYIAYCALSSPPILYRRPSRPAALNACDEPTACAIFDDISDGLIDWREIFRALVWISEQEESDD